MTVGYDCMVMGGKCEKRKLKRIKRNVFKKNKNYNVINTLF